MRKPFSDKTPTRARQVLLLGACLCVFVAALHEPARSQEEHRPVIFRTQTMGTWATLTLVTADSAAAVDVAYESLVILHSVDSLMSNWTETSEVARINREAAFHDVEVHPDVAEVLRLALQVGRDSGGAFDLTIEPLVRVWGFLGGTPRVPQQEDIDSALELIGQDKLRFDEHTRNLRFSRDGVRIDLGGVAKGYGVDRVADALRRAGVTDALVDLSGNMVALGKAAGRDGWTLGVRDPTGKHAYLARLVIEDEAIATSGDYEQFVGAGGKRYGHILDPRTGWSASGVTSVTVVSERAMVADAWATALFVLGPDEARRIAHEREDLAAILIEPMENGELIIWVEEDLRSRFQPSDNLEIKLTVHFF